jgi:hypothetical protein
MKTYNATRLYQQCPIHKTWNPRYGDMFYYKKGYGRSQIKMPLRDPLQEYRSTLEERMNACIITQLHVYSKNRKEGEQYSN